MTHIQVVTDDFSREKKYCRIIKNGDCEQKVTWTIALSFSIWKVLSNL